MNNDDFTIQPLLFPCLFGMARGLIPLDESAVRRFILKRHLAGNTFLFSHGASDNMKVRFVIDRLGKFRDVQTIRGRRAWAKPFSKVIDFARTEVEILPGTTLTHTALIERLNRDLNSWDRHVSVANCLLRQARKWEPDEMFDALRFREFWSACGYPIATDQWMAQIPTSPRF